MIWINYYIFFIFSELKTEFVIKEILLLLISSFDIKTEFVIKEILLVLISSSDLDLQD